MQDIDLECMETVEGGLSWACFWGAAGVGAISGSIGGPLGAIVGGVGGAIVADIYC